jgi:hypothetical protein
VTLSYVYSAPTQHAYADVTTSAGISAGRPCQLNHHLLGFSTEQ